MTDQTKTAADECDYLISLARVQVVHVDAGLAEWHEVAATLRRAEDAAMRAAAEDASAA